MQDEPYRPPNSQLAGDIRDENLAPLGSRFVGMLIDSGSIFGALLLGAPVMMMDPNFGEPNSEPGVLGMTGAAISLVAMVVLTGVQWYWISTLGQSIGKRVMKIQIRMIDGSAVDFVSGVIMRIWIIGLITGVLNVITCGLLGWVVFVVDGALIFGIERRCLHDKIAKTMVIELESP